MATPTTIFSSIEKYLEIVRDSRSDATARTYRNAMMRFLITLRGHGLDPEQAPPADISEQAIGWFAADLKTSSPATERLYLTVAANYFEFLSAEDLAKINLSKVKSLIQRRARKPGQRLPQFPADRIDEIVNHMINMTYSIGDEFEHLRLLRDRAFLITLADTGLRVHEACGLSRGSIDWNEGRAVIIGKGNRQDVVRFSRRSMDALRRYLQARATLDGSSGKPLGSLPLFARHDKGAGKKVRGITTTTGRDIVNHWVKLICGDEAVGTITPHSFRHYFVTRVLQGSGNLKLAQELARHKNIAVTQRYAHLSDDELDRGYLDVFE